MIGTTLGHYRILRRLGAGGMGEVYAAEDTRLQREVALKVLPPELAGDPRRRERFKREVLAVAAMDHPNIVTIYSVESAGDVHFFTMQLVPGNTLAELIPAEGLSFRQFLNLALCLADALSAAHRKGTTHRDLKPGNVMVGEDGRLRVLDFGLAKLADGAAPAGPQEETRTHGGAQLTGEGTVIGTTAYMSPEQVKGLPVDPRSDVFSLGTMLHEMATGSRPFAGDAAAEVMSAILRDTPESICTGRREFPPGAGRIVLRCLSKNPDDRYADAGGLHEDLENLKRATAGALREGAEGFQPAREGGEEAPEITSSFELPVRPSLAVLPFVNLSGDPEQDYFAAGLWTDVNADLVKVSGLFLISTITTGLYKGRSVSPREVGTDLGVRYVLQGTVRRAGERVRITTELVDTQTSEPIWAERYDRKIEDLFELQDEITEEIVTAMDVKLLHGEGHRIMRQSLKSPAARESYYKALSSLFTHNREDIVEARRLLDKVAEIEPGSPLSHVFSAFSHYFDATLGFGESVGRSLDLALAEADKAIERDDPTGSGHMIKGVVQLMRRQHDEALQASEVALRDRPNCPWVYALRGAIMNYTGKPAEAIEMARVAMRHTPLFPPIFPAVLATGHYLSGQPDQAADAARGTLQLAPDNLEAHVILAAALAASDRAGEAQPALAEVRRLKGDFSLDEFARNQPYRDPAVLDHLLADLRAAGLE